MSRFSILIFCLFLQACSSSGVVVSDSMLGVGLDSDANSLINFKIEEASNLVTNSTMPDFCYPVKSETLKFQVVGLKKIGDESENNISIMPTITIMEIKCREQTWSNFISENCLTEVVSKLTENSLDELLSVVESRYKAKIEFSRGSGSKIWHYQNKYYPDSSYTYLAKMHNNEVFVYIIDVNPRTLNLIFHFLKS